MGYGIGAVVAGVALSVKPGLVCRGAIGACACLLLVAAVLLERGVPRSVTLKEKPANDEAGGRGYRVLWADRPYLALVGLNTVVQAALQTSVVRLIRPLPRPVSLCLAGVLWASWAALTAGPLWLPRASWVPCLTVAVLCYSAAQLVHSPVSNALSADAAPADVRGRYIAVFQYSFAIATVVAPLLFSALFDLSSVAPWATLAALALLTVPGMPALAPRLPRAAPATGGAGRSAARQRGGTP